jgi:endonuclease G
MVRQFALVLTAWIVIAVGHVGPAYGQEEDNPDKVDQLPLEFPVRTAVRRSILKVRPREAGPSAEQQRQIKDNCLWGLPKKTVGADVGPTRIVCRDGYVLEHSSESRIPLWVAEHCTREELTGNLPRTNPFRPDPKLNRAERSELADYRGSGFDRGHLAPNGNQKVDDRLRRETFFLSNIVPQVGKEFNQSIWADLEDQVRKWAKPRGEAFIITGSLFYDPEEEDPDTADGLVEVTLIGDNEVAVPTHLFKIVVAKNSSDEWQSIAFVMDNKNHGEDEPFEQHIQSIDWIEERAGFNFMPNMQAETGIPDIEQRLESRRSSIWN